MPSSTALVNMSSSRERGGRGGEGGKRKRRGRERKEKKEREEKGGREREGGGRKMSKFLVFFSAAILANLITLISS